MFVLDPRHSLTADQLYGSQRVYDLIAAAETSRHAGNVPAAINLAAEAAALCELVEHRARCQRVLAALHLAAGQYEICERESLEAATALPGERDNSLRLAYEARRARTGDAGAREIADLTVSARFADPLLRAYARARTLLRWGHAGPALAEMNEAIAGGPAGVPEFFALRAELKATLRDLAGAEADVERTLALSPASTDALMVRARLRSERADLAGAAADTSKVIELCTGLLDARSEEEALWTVKLAQAFSLRARIRLAQGRFDDAAEDAIASTGRDPTVLQYWLTRIEAEAAAATAAEAMETVELAAFTQTDPADKARVFTLCARLHVEQKDLPAALHAVNRAVRLADDYAPAYRERARVWSRLGDDNKASRDVKRADELEGTGPPRERDR
jgi:tetratricopeptide (TPR) repeat protein